MTSSRQSLTPVQRINLLSAVADAVRSADAQRPRRPDEPAVLAEVEKNLDTLVAIVRRSSADRMEPYLDQIQQEICSHCPNQLPNGHCPLRSCGECAFFRNARHVICAIAGVIDGEATAAAAAATTTATTGPPVSRAKAPILFRRILIALDHSDPAAYAARAGIDLAARLGAAVALLTVVPPPPAIIPTLTAAEATLDQRWESAKRLLARSRNDVPCNVRAEEILSEGLPADEIVLTARSWRADVVVVGTHSRHGISRLLLGSTAEAVVRRAPCAVLVVRQPAAGPPVAGIEELLKSEFSGT